MKLESNICLSSHNTSFSSALFLISFHDVILANFNSGVFEGWREVMKNGSQFFMYFNVAVDTAEYIYFLFLVGVGIL